MTRIVKVINTITNIKPFSNKKISNKLNGEILKDIDNYCTKLEPLTPFIIINTVKGNNNEIKFVNIPKYT